MWLKRGATAALLFLFVISCAGDSLYILPSLSILSCDDCNGKFLADRPLLFDAGDTLVSFDGDPTYTFAFGDGFVTRSQSAVVNHVYTRAGHYMVTLWVNDRSADVLHTSNSTAVPFVSTNLVVEETTDCFGIRAWLGDDVSGLGGSGWSAGFYYNATRPVADNLILFPDAEYKMYIGMYDLRASRSPSYDPETSSVDLQSSLESLDLVDIERISSPKSEVLSRRRVFTYSQLSVAREFVSSGGQLGAVWDNNTIYFTQAPSLRESLLNQLDDVPSRVEGAVWEATVYGGVFPQTTLLTLTAAGFNPAGLSFTAGKCTVRTSTVPVTVSPFRRLTTRNSSMTAASSNRSLGDTLLRYNFNPTYLQISNDACNPRRSLAVLGAAGHYAPLLTQTDGTWSLRNFTNQSVGVPDWRGAVGVSATAPSLEQFEPSTLSSLVVETMDSFGMLSQVVDIAANIQDTLSDSDICLLCADWESSVFGSPQPQANFSCLKTMVVYDSAITDDYIILLTSLGVIQSSSLRRVDLQPGELLPTEFAPLSYKRTTTGIAEVEAGGNSNDTLSANVGSLYGYNASYLNGPPAGTPGYVHVAPFNVTNAIASFHTLTQLFTDSNHPLHDYGWKSELSTSFQGLCVPFLGERSPASVFVRHRQRSYLNGLSSDRTRTGNDGLSNIWSVWNQTAVNGVRVSRGRFNYSNPSSEERSIEGELLWTELHVPTNESLWSSASKEVWQFPEGAVATQPNAPLPSDHSVFESRSVLSKLNVLDLIRFDFSSPADSFRVIDATESEENMVLLLAPTQPWGSIKRSSVQSSGYAHFRTVVSGLSTDEFAAGYIFPRAAVVLSIVAGPTGIMALGDSLWLSTDQGKTFPHLASLPTDERAAGITFSGYDSSFVVVCYSLNVYKGSANVPTVELVRSGHPRERDSVWYQPMFFWPLSTIFTLFGAVDAAHMQRHPADPRRLGAGSYDGTALPNVFPVGSTLNPYPGKNVLHSSYRRASSFLREGSNDDWVQISVEAPQDYRLLSSLDFPAGMLVTNNRSSSSYTALSSGIDESELYECAQGGFGSAEVWCARRYSADAATQLDDDQTFQRSLHRLFSKRNLGVVGVLEALSVNYRVLSHPQIGFAPSPNGELIPWYTVNGETRFELLTSSLSLWHASNAYLYENNEQEVPRGSGWGTKSSDAFASGTRSHLVAEYWIGMQTQTYITDTNSIAALDIDTDDEGYALSGDVMGEYPGTQTVIEDVIDLTDHFDRALFLRNADMEEVHASVKLGGTVPLVKVSPGSGELYDAVNSVFPDNLDRECTVHAENSYPGGLCPCTNPHRCPFIQHAMMLRVMNVMKAKRDSSDIPHSGFGSYDDFDLYGGEEEQLFAVGTTLLLTFPEWSPPPAPIPRWDNSTHRPSEWEGFLASDLHRSFQILGGTVLISRIYNATHARGFVLADISRPRSSRFSYQVINETLGVSSGWLKTPAYALQAFDLGPHLRLNHCGRQTLTLSTVGAGAPDSGMINMTLSSGGFRFRRSLHVGAVFRIEVALNGSTGISDSQNDSAIFPDACPSCPWGIVVQVLGDYDALLAIGEHGTHRWVGGFAQAVFPTTDLPLTLDSWEWSLFGMQPGHLRTAGSANNGGGSGSMWGELPSLSAARGRWFLKQMPCPTNFMATSPRVRSTVYLDQQDWFVEQYAIGPSSAELEMRIHNDLFLSMETSEASMATVDFVKLLHAPRERFFERDDEVVYTSESMMTGTIDRDQLLLNEELIAAAGGSSVESLLADITKRVMFSNFDSLGSRDDVLELGSDELLMPSLSSSSVRTLLLQPKRIQQALMSPEVRVIALNISAADPSLTGWSSVTVQSPSQPNHCPAASRILDIVIGCPPSKQLRVEVPFTLEEFSANEVKGLFTLPVNYRPPSPEGKGIPKTENFYNADPSKAKYNNRFDVSKRTGRYKRCAEVHIGHWSNDTCQCTPQMRFSEFVNDSDCTQQVRTHPYTDLFVPRFLVTEVGKEDRYATYPMEIIEVNGRTEYCFNTTACKGDSSDRTGTFNTADFDAIMFLGDELFHFRATVVGESYCELVAEFKVYIINPTLNEVIEQVVISVTAMVVGLVLFVGYLVYQYMYGAWLTIQERQDTLPRDASIR